ncbi:bifunctional diaminohydroxyphosphoribosylaminopyrimidine deaminase/5-amino-6-(5-phosphoribosylamino)uracil reductase RibD [Polluticoccus soli]|uniref:bifunctional diaminohydroxyphosphoribosylaminopyrimidine deaminase/5-amino-6-(5-phosphoribosylamino)uracil reductase RibD n=1 Tax=Polluticoccus soli TaxID=3034150 RepID=UPI0023E1B6E4|nr:bifunctional diaminohydroxyphosphoribosylaminopyrimidine deaminase/5-amino-6-(5-phosphoribosylamino)uracil reductase RibD [Flavipsychrobacter sp. JY13-12]
MAGHEVYMRRCFELAQLAKGYTLDNPMVGAVLVHNGRIIGEGYHREYGKAHAEVNCLESVADADHHLIPESTMYVNLEPCAHHGKTPPCASRLVKERVKEVIVCNIDPFEKVEGRGMEILHEANIATQTGVLEKEGWWLNRRFFCFHRHQRPYIILKWAQTESGFFAPADRSRFQISNEHSKQLLHKWRTEEAAIMVGYNTALNDDPQLTSRLWPGKQPLRIVLDERLQLPGTLKLFNNEASTWVINGQKDDDRGNIRFMQMPFNNLLPGLMNKLHQARMLSLIVEGGAHLIQSFIDAGLWDQARIFSAGADLPNGIAAPLLPNATKAFETPLGFDTLHVYVNNDSSFPYAAGMSL